MHVYFYLWNPVWKGYAVLETLSKRPFLAYIYIFKRYILPVYVQCWVVFLRVGFRLQCANRRLHPKPLSLIILAYSRILLCIAPFSTFKTEIMSTYTGCSKFLSQLCNILNIKDGSNIQTITDGSIFLWIIVPWHIMIFKKRSVIHYLLRGRSTMSQ